MSSQATYSQRLPDLITNTLSPGQADLIHASGLLYNHDWVTDLLPEEHDYCIEVLVLWAFANRQRKPVRLRTFFNKTFLQLAPNVQNVDSFWLPAAVANQYKNYPRRIVDRFMILVRIDYIFY